MATPRELVDDRLRQLGMSPTDLGLRLGYKNGYQAYHDLFVSGRIKLTDSKLLQIADILELPKEHFVNPDATAARERYVRARFQEFLSTEIGRGVDPDVRRTLESMKFLGRWLPSVHMYQAVALAMEGRYTMAQLADALELEEDDRKGSAPATAAPQTRRRQSSRPPK